MHVEFGFSADYSNGNVMKEVQKVALGAQEGATSSGIVYIRTHQCTGDVPLESSSFLSPSLSLISSGFIQ